MKKATLPFPRQITPTMKKNGRNKSEKKLRKLLVCVNRKEKVSRKQQDMLPLLRQRSKFLTTYQQSRD
jgi:hypothetical protein